MNYSTIKNQIRFAFLALVLFICAESKAQLKLIHYWDMNSTAPSGGGGGTNLSPLKADYSTFPSGIANLSLGVPPTSYTLDNGSGGATVNEYHPTSVTSNDTASASVNNLYIRARNPLQNIPFKWTLPTTNYENIVLTFASELSSAGKGVLSYSYSLDGGTTIVALPVGTYTPGTTWSTSTLNLTTLIGAGVNNNPNFVFIVANTLNTTGNYRFDNIALQGDTVTVSAAATNIACFGGVGSATATPNGTGPYTYTWSPSGGNASVASNLTVGIYTVSITDTYSITATATVAVTQPAAALSASISSSTNVNCFGNVTGAATALASGGTAGYTYTWSPSGGNTATASSLAAGGYTVNITDAKGCTTNTMVTITQPASALSASISSSTNVNCFGNNTGSATASVSGGTAGYTYTWSPSGGNAATASSLASGGYTVNITDVNGCTTNTMVTITQPASALSANISASTNVKCNGGSNGSATVTVSGGTAGYTYTWSPSGGNTNMASNLAAGSYTVNVTDAKGCTANTSVTLTQPATAPTASITASTNVTCFGLSNGTATVTGSGGTGPYTYSWNNNQTSSNATNLSATANNKLIYYWDMNTTLPAGGGGLTNLSPLQSEYPTSGRAAYLVFNNGANSIVDNGAGGGTMNEYTVLGNDSASGNLYIRARNPSYNVPFNWFMPTTNYKNIKLTYAAELSSAGKGVSSYAYSLDSGLTFINTGILVNGVSATSYTPPIAWATVTIDLSNIPAISNNPRFVFQITNSLSTATTTSGNCRFDNIALRGDTITSGPIYSAIVTDANGCTSNVASVTITQPALLTTTISASTNVNCHGGNTGSATASIAGGNTSFTYTWSPSGGNAATASNLTAGSYTINVTDNKGCTASNTVSITQPATAVSASITASSNVQCNGGSTGTATATATGGTPAYTYTWSPSGGNGATGTNLAAGSYTLNVTDNKGCPASATVTITQPNVMTASITSFTNVNCNGSNNGAATSTPVGGSGNYTYQWDDANNQTTATANNLLAGTYNCLVTDATCHTTTSNSVAISQPNLMTASVTGSANITCHGGNTGNATVTALAGSGTYSYQWNDANNQTTAMASNLVAGSYTCIVTDITCGTTVTNTVTLTQPSLMIASVTSFSNVACNGNNTGSATVAASLGSGTYSYQWNDVNNQTTAMASNLAAGSYTCVVTDVTCNTTVTNTVTITQPNAMTASITTFSNVACNGGNTGSATVAAMNGSGVYSYQWNDANNQTTAMASNLASGSYTCITTDVTCGTTVTNTVNLTQPNAMTASVTSFSNANCFGNSDGNATVTAMNGSGTYTYQWNDANNQTTAVASNLVAGSYTCVVTDVTCNTTVTNTVNIAQPEALAIDSVIIDVSNDVTVYPSGGVPIGSPVSYTYSWTPGGATTATINTAAPGMYTVCVTSIYGCGTTCSSVTVTGTTGIAAKTANNSVNVYPSPSSGAFTIDLGGDNYYSLKIYDELGREIYSQSLDASVKNKSLKIDLSNQTNKNGVYTLQLFSSAGVVTKRIIIQK